MGPGRGRCVTLPRLLAGISPPLLNPTGNASLDSIMVSMATAQDFTMLPSHPHKVGAAQARALSPNCDFKFITHEYGFRS